MAYDPAVISGFYDRYGEREWERYFRSPADRVNLHVHLHFLRRFVERGMHVLDVGAGPGRFTIELARLGARVTVADLSAEMLRQNRARVREAGAEEVVVAREQVDVTDLSIFKDGAFDAVVCFGGPLSYVLERADDAVAELVRVLRPGGVLLSSVMSTVGSTRSLLPAVLELTERIGMERVREVLEDGVLTEGVFRNDHVLKMYRWEEYRSLLERHDLEVLVASASNFLSVSSGADLDDLSGEGWEAFLDWELYCCRQPGAIDGGTHILTITRAPI